ncbi:MAG: NUDIX domain-containing protein [Alphaproteobacteria bacterium]
MTQSHTLDGKHIRITVGSLVFNEVGEVLMGYPIRDRVNEGWHFSQGGKESKERALTGSRRELGEEFGVGRNDVFTIAAISAQPFYPVPGNKHPEIYHGLILGFHAFLMRPGSKINLESRLNGEPPEYKDYRWVELNEVAAICPAYKAEAYKPLVAAATPIADAIKAIHQSGIILPPRKLVQAVRNNSFVAAAFEVGQLAPRLPRFPGKPYRRPLLREHAA